MTEETPLGDRGRIVDFPITPLDVEEVALEELEAVFAFLYSRAGNRADAEDLTQQVAVKALPRLRAGVARSSIRAYLFATARSILAQFWATRFEVTVEELPAEIASLGPGAVDAAPAAVVERILERLLPAHRRVLELRFLRGYSLKEVAAETGSTVGGVKLMQLRALRAAAKVGLDG